MSVKSYGLWVKLMTVTSDNINLKSQVITREFETVFSEHWSQVYGVIFRLIGDQDEAQDLALETFWRYYRKPPASSDNLGGWLYRVAVNLGYNALRTRKRRLQRELAANATEMEHESSSDPEQALIIAEQRSSVQFVLTQMKPRSAKLLVLRYSGLNYAEIAEVLNMKATSVGKSLTRAQDEFETLYRRFEGG